MFQLPQELQELIWEFDGRYKTAFQSCLTIIRSNEPLTSIWENEFAVFGNRLWNDEYERRAKIKKNVNMRLGRTHTDVFGLYRVYLRPKMIISNGEVYASVCKYPSLLPARTLCKCVYKGKMMKNIQKLERKRKKKYV